MTWEFVSISVRDAIVLITISAATSAFLALLLTFAFRTLMEEIKQKPFHAALVEIFAIATPFAIVGIVSGFLTGASRSAAVSATVPAVLTLFGGMVAYLLTQGIKIALLAGLAVSAFSCTLLLGAIIGSLERQAVDAIQSSVAQGYRDAERELAVDAYRKNLGLPSLKPHPAQKTDRDESKP